MTLIHNINNNSHYNCHIVSTYVQKKLVVLVTQTNSNWQVGKILKLWGKKAIVGIALF